MKAVISRLSHSNGVWRLLFFKTLSQYSTTAPEPPQVNFLVPHLQTLVGLSREEAIAATNKVNLWKTSTKDPILVLNFFQELGLDKAQIKTIVSRDPRLILYDVDKTLKPKIRVLQELGFSGSDLNKLIVFNRDILSKSVNYGIRNPIEFLRNLLGSDENVAKAVKKFAVLFDISRQKNIRSNVEVLKGVGFSDERILKYFFKSPSRFVCNPQLLEEVICRVENEFGIPRESKMFYHGVDVISSSKRATFDAKFEMYRSCGFRDEQICKMFRTFPFVLSKSEAKVRETIDYIVGELGCDRDYLVSYPVLFSLSMEKRMKPRYEVMKVLRKRKLIKKIPGLCYLFYVSESKFVSYFLLPHMDKIPDIYRSYMKVVGKKEIGAL
ncbi:hypothetical protein ACH5RR_026745 [Cinchona calisaya]|uniref:Uncharacterized protein n=1 Tax=Cinchona calisaya TaxID=153742 RepID=A0ABD2Z4H8_9GENT